ncbi:MAG: hypothetical protein AVDCRST_MAG20-2574, partial [uncultured Acidimicrobiales bacterium]
WTDRASAGTASRARRRRRRRPRRGGCAERTGAARACRSTTTVRGAASTHRWSSPAPGGGRSTPP